MHFHFYSLRIFAIDNDEGQNARLLYNLTEADPRFTIDSDGGIITSESLKENESYQLTVKVTFFHLCFAHTNFGFLFEPNILYIIAYLKE